MKLTLAIEVCEDWLARLDKDRENAEKLAEIASLRRKGEIDITEARKRVLEVTGHSPRVYDASDLAEAVRCIIKELPSGKAQ